MDGGESVEGVEAEWNQQAAALDLAIAGQREAGGNGGGDRCSERERDEKGDQELDVSHASCVRASVFFLFFRESVRAC